MTQSPKIQRNQCTLRSSSVGLLLLLGAGTALSGCQQHLAAAGEAPSPPVHVEQADVREQPVPRVLQLTGTLRGKQQTDVAANAAGRVVETFVERGSEVKKGDLLARLDVRAAALTAAETRANAELARSQAVTAQRECDRYARLAEQSAISQAEYDRISDSCRTSTLSIAAAQARAQGAAQLVGDGAIRAPFTGVVGERFVQVGEYVRQDTRIVTLVASDTLRLELTVPEAHLATVKEGGALTFTVPTYPGRMFSGTVRFVGTSVRETTRDLVAEALVDNPDRALRPGMFATIALLTGDAPMPVVPKTALFEKDGRSHVFVVAKQRLEERVVQLGTPLGEVVPVIRGLHSGDHVVVKPSESLHNGQAVN